MALRLAWGALALGLAGCTWIPLGVCGNGLVEGDEACDDGNDRDGDGCTNACEEAVCGDGIVWQGVEACDAGAQNADTGACGPDCQVPVAPVDD